MNIIKSELTAAETSQIWAWYRAGSPVPVIARNLNREKKSVYRELARHGGITPAVRRESARALSLSEREEISRGVVARESARAIGRRLNRAPSTIGREIERNGGAQLYRAIDAQHAAQARRPRPKICRLAQNRPLSQIVAEKLSANWSPQQIAGYLKRVYKEDKSMQVSHETIYRSLFVQARGALKKELTLHLRSRRSIRRGRKSTRSGQGRGQIVGAVSISQRPAEAADRAVPGHWEGDLIIGSKRSQIATLVERHSRFTVLVKVDSRHADVVAAALAGRICALPEDLRRTLTWDRGLELAHHAKITMDTQMAVFFADPHSPWQRGTNENTNGLLRQYYPKGTDVSGYTQEQLDAVALELNTRPRKTLGYETPAERLNARVATTT